MKNKFSSFLVTERKAILIAFIILAVGFGIMIPFVHVNYDMTEYLPDDSSMKQGLDIMKAEFGDEESSKLIVMFDDLKSNEEKKETLGLLSFAFTEEAISQICRILSLGCLAATLLVIFVLPGIMACLDRLIVKKIN